MEYKGGETENWRKTQRVVFSFDERSLESLQKIKDQAGSRRWERLCAIPCKSAVLCSRRQRRDSAKSWFGILKQRKSGSWWCRLCTRREVRINAGSGGTINASRARTVPRLSREEPLSRLRSLPFEERGIVQRPPSEASVPLVASCRDDGATSTD